MSLLRYNFNSFICAMVNKGKTYGVCCRVLVPKLAVSIEVASNNNILVEINELIQVSGERDVGWVSSQ